MAWIRPHTPLCDLVSTQVDAADVDRLTPAGRTAASSTARAGADARTSRRRRLAPLAVEKCGATRRGSRGRRRGIPHRRRHVVFLFSFYYFCVAPRRNSFLCVDY